METLKYKWLADELRREIKSGELKPDTRIKPECELSREYSVSRQTVRKALETLTDEHLIYRKRGSGTYISHAPGRKALARVVGMITSYASYYIFSDQLRGIENELRAQNYNMLLMATQNQVCVERYILQDMLSQPIDGLIVECTQLPRPNPNIELYEKIRQSGVPIVFINGAYPGLEDWPRVCVDDRAGGYYLAKRFIDDGITNIGGIFKSDGHGIDRYYGCIKACIDAGLSFSEDNFLWFSSKESDECIGTIAKARGLDNISHMDALVCYNDLSAISTIDILRRCGCERLPRVACFDNTEVLKLSSANVISVTYPVQQVSKRAVQKLMNLISGRREEPEIIQWIETENNNFGVL